MHTRIVIRHETVEALKSSALWQQIMALAFADGQVSVVEIARAEDPDTGDADDIRARCAKLAYDAVLQFPGMKEHQAKAVATAVAYFDE